MSASMLRIGVPSDGIGFIPTVLSDAVSTGVIRVGGTRKGYDFAIYDNYGGALSCGDLLANHAPYFDQYSNYEPEVLDKHRDSFLQPKSMVASGDGKLNIVNGLRNGSEHRYMGNPLGYPTRQNAYSKFYMEFIEHMAKAYERDLGVLNMPVFDVSSSGYVEALFPSTNDLINATGRDMAEIHSLLNAAMLSFFTDRDFAYRRLPEGDFNSRYPDGGGILTVESHRNGAGVGEMPFQVFTQDVFMGNLSFRTRSNSAGLEFKYRDPADLSIKTHRTTGNLSKYGLAFFGGDDFLNTQECHAIMAEALFNVPEEVARTAEIAPSMGTNGFGRYAYRPEGSDSFVAWPTSEYGPLDLFGTNLMNWATPSLTVSSVIGYYPSLANTEALFNTPVCEVYPGRTHMDLRNSWIPGATSATTRCPCVGLPGFIRVFSPSGPSLIQFTGEPKVSLIDVNNFDIEMDGGSISMMLSTSVIRNHLEWMLSVNPGDEKLTKQIEDMAESNEMLFGTILSEGLVPPNGYTDKEQFRLAREAEKAELNVLEIKISDANPVVTIKSARNRIQNMEPQRVWVVSSRPMQKPELSSSVQSLFASSLSKFDHVMSLGQNFSGEVDLDNLTMYVVDKNDPSKTPKYTLNSFEEVSDAYAGGYRFDDTVPDEYIQGFADEYGAYVVENGLVQKREDPFEWKTWDPQAFCSSDGFPSPRKFYGDERTTLDTDGGLLGVFQNATTDARHRMWIAYKCFNNAGVEKIFEMFARPVPE